MTAPAPFAPTPALQLLQDAARLLDADGPAGAVLAALATDWPHSLRRRPAQLLREAGAAPQELDRLLAGAGFADLDQLRRVAERETGTRLPAPEIRITYRDDDDGRTDRAYLERTLRREQDNLADTLRTLRSSGALELAARAVLGSRRRWVFGDMKSRGYAHLFAADLTSALGGVSLVEPTSAGALAAVSDGHPRDSLTVFCFRRYSRLTVRLARSFAELGAAVVAITDTEDGPLRPYATHTLRVATRSATPTHSPAAVAATGHALAALTAAGAKGAARRNRHKQELAAALDWYVGDPAADVEDGGR